MLRVSSAVVVAVALEMEWKLETGAQASAVVDHANATMTLAARGAVSADVRVSTSSKQSIANLFAWQWRCRPQGLRASKNLIDRLRLIAKHCQTNTQFEVTTDHPSQVEYLEHACESPTDRDQEAFTSQDYEPRCANTTRPRQRRR